MRIKFPKKALTNNPQSAHHLKRVWSLISNSCTSSNRADRSETWRTRTEVGTTQSSCSHRNTLPEPPSCPPLGLSVCYLVRNKHTSTHVGKQARTLSVRTCLCLSTNKQENKQGENKEPHPCRDTNYAQSPSRHRSVKQTVYTAKQFTSVM